MVGQGYTCGPLLVATLRWHDSTLMSISKMLQNGTAAADIKGEALANELANLKFEGLSGVSALMQTETDLRHMTY